MTLTQTGYMTLQMGLSLPCDKWVGKLSVSKRVTQMLNMVRLI